MVSRVKFRGGYAGDLGQSRHQRGAGQVHPCLPPVDRHPRYFDRRPEILLRLLRILAFPVGCKGMGDLGHAKSYTENVTSGQPLPVSRETYPAQ